MSTSANAPLKPRAPPLYLDTYRNCFGNVLRMWLEKSLHSVLNTESWFSATCLTSMISCWHRVCSGFPLSSFSTRGNSEGSDAAIISRCVSTRSISCVKNATLRSGEQLPCTTLNSCGDCKSPSASHLLASSALKWPKLRGRGGRAE